jgi:hypothetical protein
MLDHSDLSYGVASLYVLADTRDKAVKMMKRSDGSLNQKVAAAAFDTLLWQVRRRSHF